MAVFQCRGVDSSGLRVVMSITADSEQTAAAELRGRGITVVSVTESAGGGLDFLNRLFPVGKKDVLLFFRMLATLIASDVTISESMMILEEQAERKGMKALLGDLRARVEGGTPLSSAMAEHASVFPEMTINMVRAGELGGILDVVLVRIADYLEKRAELRAKTLLSLMYPAVVVVAAVVVVIFLVAFVIPKFASLLGGRKLPWNTQFLLDSAAYLKANGMEIGLGAAGFAGFIAILFSLPQTRVFLDRYRMYIPVVGPIFRLSVIVQFARTFSALLESRIPVIEALRASNETIANTAVNEGLDSIIDRVLGGEPLSTAMHADAVFTPMVRALVGIGEHSGMMDQAMATVAELHEKTLQDKIARMSAMIEPVLIITLGGIVGFVAWGLVAGMLAMYSGAK